MMPLNADHSAGFSTKGPLRPLLNLFSNVWFGILLAALLFFYCSIGSAVPAVRESPALEMTEFQWFHWWPFQALVALFCLTLVTVTVRRIPLRLVNLGVWTIHAGIIVLVIGSYRYFTEKIEGDTPVFRRQVRVELPGLAQPAALVAVPGSSRTVLAGPDQWTFQIQSTNSEWPILSEEHKGERAYAVNVQVTPPGGEPFVRQLLAGYPQYTEDVIPGKGRAIKALGRKLVDERLSLTLQYEPQTQFHVMDTVALYVRRKGEREWVQRRIDHLPRYHEHISARDQVYLQPGENLPLRTLDLVVSPAVSTGYRPVPHTDALSAARVHVTGYLPYASMEQRWREGGEQLNPVVEMTLLGDRMQDASFELVAFDPARSTAGEGNVQLVWLQDSSRLTDLPRDSRALLRVAVPDKNVSLELPITPSNVVGSSGEFTPIEGTDFEYRIVNVQDNLAMPSGAGTVSVAMVDVKTPEGQFTRMVADPAEKTRDIVGDRRDPHTAPRPPDPRIPMTYQPASATVILAAHPGGLHLVFNNMQGRVFDRPVRVGETVELTPSVGLRVDRFFATAVSEVKPNVVPPFERQSRVGQNFAMIRVEVETERGVQSQWLRFHSHVFPDETYAYAGRFMYSPAVFRGPDGRPVEMIFSRERRALPYAIALDDFTLDTHIGGYSGAVSTIRNYVSRLRFRINEAWSEPVEIAVNHPAEAGRFWYFQSTWDKPQANDPAGGMNFTGLGVGNREGVYVQLLGCCMAVTGMGFAFYVKPVIKRRRAERARARASRSKDDDFENRDGESMPSGGWSASSGGEAALASGVLTGSSEAIASPGPMGLDHSIKERLT